MRHFQCRMLWRANSRLLSDVEQAFHRVWHASFLLKLKEILHPDCYGCLITSFLRNRTFRVSVVLERTILSFPGKDSHHWHSSIKHPATSPLFSVYVNEPNSLEWSCPCLTTTRQNILSVANASVDWASKCKVSVNVSKSRDVVFSRCRKPPNRLMEKKLLFIKNDSSPFWIDALDGQQKLTISHLILLLELGVRFLNTSVRSTLRNSTDAMLNFREIP